MYFSNFQKVPKSLRVYVILQLNITSTAFQAFLYNVYKCNCEPVQLFAAIIVSWALWVLCSAFLDPAGSEIFHLNKPNVKFDLGHSTASLSCHLKKCKGMSDWSGEREIYCNQWVCNWKMSIKCFSIPVGNKSFIAFYQR